MFYKQGEIDSDDYMKNKKENQSKIEFTNDEIYSSPTRSLNATIYTNVLIEDEHINKEDLPNVVEEKKEEEIIHKKSINNKLSIFAFVIKKTIWMSSSSLLTFIITFLIFPGLYFEMPFL